ncbi:MAG: ABC transporter transmembrane domain-containing protein, partial [Thermoanaerobaculia bacterium]
MRQLAPILPYFRNHPWKLASGLACIAGSVCLALTVPLLVGRAIDTLRQTGNLGHQVDSRLLLKYAAALVGITAVQGIFTFGQRLLLVSLSRDVEFELRNDYFAHLER